MLGLQNEREWVAFCERVLRQPALAIDARFASNSLRSEHRDALRALILVCFSALTADEVAVRLDAAQITNARVSDMHDVWQHPQLRARGRWTEVGSPQGVLPALLPPAGHSSFAPRMAAVPALGEHTDAILAELGWSVQAVAGLRAQAAV